MSSFGSSVSCAWSQVGCQSPEQPISLLRLPGTLTLAGWVTGPTPPPPPLPPAGAGSPTTPYVEVAGEHAVLHEGALGVAADVVEDAVRGVVVGAERRPRRRAGRTREEGDVGER